MHVTYKNTNSHFVFGLLWAVLMLRPMAPEGEVAIIWGSHRARNGEEGEGGEDFARKAAEV